MEPGAYGLACVNRCLDLPYYLVMILLMRYTGLREMDPVHVVSEPLCSGGYNNDSRGATRIEERGELTKLGVHRL